MPAVVADGPTGAGRREEVEVAALPRGRAYPWLTASVVPRPIAWVSSTSADGVDNLAPHSFFSVASADPPVLCFTSVGTKDTLRNVRATGEFVVCLTPRGLVEAVNRTGTDFPAERSEYDEAPLTREPSVTVRPPRVAESPVAFECRVVGEHPFGKSTVVFGEVVHIAADRDCLAADGLPDPALLDPVSRLGRDEWGTLGEVLRLTRLRWSDLQ